MSEIWKTRISLLLTVIFILNAVPYGFVPRSGGEQAAGASFEAAQGSGALDEAADTWIIRWEDEVPAEFAAESEIVGVQDFLQVTIAKPREPADLEAWLARWSKAEEVRYIQPNHLVRTAAVPNDPYRSEQRYLDLIGAYTAWDHVNSNTSITIAVVDTGVDLNHPDLKGNLTEGYNLLDKNKPPQDDNGHGTNVAGIIAAVGNNRIGTTGILWNAKIMPLKALDRHGTGNEDHLGEAIRYAVDNGAKIVVMSLGLHRYSPYMQDIVNYAEENGVLLVAAAGNEGSDVKYPAAYPTVLAVGGIGSNRSTINESNYGPEIDLVAPWEVYTTALGGGYEVNYGTSMAAPQVAAVAAMVWSKHPNWTPAEVRNMLRQTAEDVHMRGWDERTGYGLVRADRALTAVYKRDMFEPNNTRNTAAHLPIDHSIIAELAGSKDMDWFYIQAPYKGSVTITLSALQSTNAQITVDHLDVNGRVLNTYPNMLGKSMTIPVTTSRSYIRVRAASESSNMAIGYELTTKFLIYSDDYEDNDRQYKAYRLQPRSQVLKGTFHQENDYDWFQIPISQDGTLRVKVSVDTSRIDPAIVIQRQGGSAREIDAGEEGKTEYSDPIDVTPGTYYILIKNVISNRTYPVTGEYTMTIEYMPKYIDPNEPNDKPYQAVMMAVGTQYNGVISSAADQDWFTFVMEDKGVVDLDIQRIPKNRTMSLTIYDSAQKMLAVYTSKLGAEKLHVRTELNQGIYYVRLTANAPFQDQMYGLTLRIHELVAGFIDIKHNWAKDAIVNLVEQNIVQGYGDYTFRPNAPLMRSEAVAMIVRAFKPQQRAAASYPDVPIRHWAYQDIARASSAGIVRGYPDGTFRPNDHVTRVEMAQMLGNALQLEELSANPGFSDIPEDYWAAGMLAALKQHGTLTGYPDGTFRPNATASRAEFANLLYKALTK